MFDLTVVALQINVLQTKKKFEILDAVSERRDGSFAALALSANVGG